jgi:hypothetical protein
LAPFLLLLPSVASLQSNVINQLLQMVRRQFWPVRADFLKWQQDLE